MSDGDAYGSGLLGVDASGAGVREVDVSGGGLREVDHARWSCLYEGVVCHRRHEPIEHTFRYRVFMAYVDLDEVDELVAAHRPLWSDRIAAPVRMRRGDYYGDDQAVPLVEAIRALVQNRTGRRPVRVRLLTNLRMFGHCFNPVSFYYCFDRGERLQAVVAEVTSTPWGERHAYVMEAESGRFVKQLHLSPFMGMDHEYECEAPAPAGTACVSVTSRHAGRRVFDATLALRRRELTRRNLARMLARYPFATARVQTRIYGQALRLWAKGAPRFAHPRSAT